MELSMQMSRPSRASRRWAGGALVLATTAGLAIAPSALARSHPADHSNRADHSHPSRHSDHARGNDRGRNHGRGHAINRAIGRYAQRNLVADTAGAAELTDPDLVNAWGLSFGPTTPAWVSDFGTGKSTLYSGGVNGSPVTKPPLTVTIPGGLPTGQVFNPTSEFVVGSGAASGPARFLFATARGTIAGWNPNVPAANSTEAQNAVRVPDASFTGLAISGDRLYAADFHNARVDVWDGNFAAVNRPGAFRDNRIPNDYAPFGIEAVGDQVVVTYAKQDANAQFDVPGAGHGFVDVFSTSGRLLRRLAAHGTLNSPWGVAQAPQGFGAASGALLIGNFGDGRIQAYAPRSGRFLGRLANTHRRPLAIDGLWALKFGNGVIGSPDALLFTAGPSQGRHGLFGELTAATSTTPGRRARPGAPTNPGTPTMPGY
jgi:uncharacterized protein (TIGR03118 family)